MEALFTKILCPIDFDRIAIAAVQLAARLAKQNDAIVYLLHVSPEAQPESRQVTHDELRAVARNWFEGKVRYEIVVRTGPPAAGVLKAQEEIGADLVVMATHARTGEKLRILGSVTDQVVRHSACPVMTVGPE